MTTPDMSAFGKYIPGFDFLQNLTRQAAGSVAPGGSSGVSGMPPLSQWVAPTFSVEDLEKRIQELRAVQFWLDQNAKALGATVQALEVQKMTLSALRGMNVKLQDVAEAFKVRPAFTGSATGAAGAPAPAPAPASAPTAQAPTGDAPEGAKPAVDPMQWWGALTQQFQTIASGAIKDMADQTAKAAEQMSQTVQATAKVAATRATAKPEAAAGQKSRAAKTAGATAAKSGKGAGSSRAAAKSTTRTATTPKPRKASGG